VCFLSVIDFWARNCLTESAFSWGIVKGENPFARTKFRPLLLLLCLNLVEEPHFCDLNVYLITPLSALFQHFRRFGEILDFYCFHHLPRSRDTL
jgi:hypothetical protein